MEYLEHTVFSSVPWVAFIRFLINFFEILAVGVLTVCIIFLIRRNISKAKTFYQKDLDGWPRSDANYILITEIILMTLFLTMNAPTGPIASYRALNIITIQEFYFLRAARSLFSGLSMHPT